MNENFYLKIDKNLSADVNLVDNSLKIVSAHNSLFLSLHFPLHFPLLN